MIDCWIKCHLCDLRFADSSAVANHVTKTKHAVKKRGKYKQNYSKCNFCDSRFSEVQAMFNHARMSHGEQISLSWKICRTCITYYPNAKSLKKHKTEECEVSIDIKDENIEVDTISDVIEPECLKQCQSIESLKVHDETCKGVVSCQYCPIIFIGQDNNSNQQQYIKHCFIKHIKEVVKTWIKCSNCDFHAPDKITIGAHEHQCNTPGVSIQSNTTCHLTIADEPKVRNNLKQCQFCDLSFPQKSNLVKHYILKHPNDIMKKKHETTECEDMSIDTKEENIEVDNIIEYDVKPYRSVKCHNPGVSIPTNTTCSNINNIKIEIKDEPNIN
jgi:hypothetical protein